MICFMFPGQPLSHDASLPDDADFSEIAALTRAHAGLDLAGFTWTAEPASEQVALQVYGTAASLYRNRALRREGREPAIVAEHSMGVDQPHSLNSQKCAWAEKGIAALRMPDAHLHFPRADTAAYRRSWGRGVRCAVMQGGQGDVKHWAFNDPLPRTGPHKDVPPSPEEYRTLCTRVVDLHPLTIAQNARTSGGGNIALVPTKAITVGPVETWQAEKVSIWHAGQHDNPFGQRLTALMISKGIVDTSVPMSLLADHPNVQFNYFRGGLGTCAVEMH